MCHILVVDAATIAGKPKGRVLDGTCLLAFAVKGDIAACGLAVAQHVDSDFVHARLKTGQVYHWTGAVDSARHDYILIVVFDFVVAIHALFVLVGGMELKRQLKWRHIVEMGTASQFYSSATANDEAMARLLRLAGIVGALSLEHIVVMVVLGLIFLETRCWKFDAELALLVGGENGVHDILAVVGGPPPPPAPLVAIHAQLHLCVGHRNATVGQCLSCNFDRLVFSEHLWHIGERDGERWSLILAHVHVVCCKVLVVAVSREDLKCEPPVHAVGGDWKFALDASVGIAFSVDGVNRLMVGVAKYYSHFPPLDGAHDLTGYNVHNSGKLQRFAWTVDVEVGKHLC